MLRRVIQALRRRNCRPQPNDGYLNAERLRKEGVATIGEDCFISPRAVITDPYLLVIGNNVRLSDCHVFGHDGSINMLNRKNGTNYDAVAPVIIGSNVFIGHGTIILPGTTIEDNVIIGAGSVVRGTIYGNGVYVGNPLRRIRGMYAHEQIVASRHNRLSLEWRELISERGPDFNPHFEPYLQQARIRHYHDVHAAKRRTGPVAAAATH